MHGLAWHGSGGEGREKKIQTERREPTLPGWRRALPTSRPTTAAGAMADCHTAAEGALRAPNQTDDPRGQRARQGLATRQRNAPTKGLVGRGPNHGRTQGKVRQLWGGGRGEERYEYMHRQVPGAHVGAARGLHSSRAGGVPTPAPASDCRCNNQQTTHANPCLQETCHLHCLPSLHSLYARCNLHHPAPHTMSCSVLSLLLAAAWPAPPPPAGGEPSWVAMVPTVITRMPGSTCGWGGGGGWGGGRGSQHYALPCPTLLGHHSPPFDC